MVGRAASAACLLGLTVAACIGPPAKRGPDGRDGSGTIGTGGVTADAGGDGGMADRGGASGSTAAAPAWTWAVRCPDGHDPTTPIDYGRCAIDQALAEAQATRAIEIATVADAPWSPAASKLSPLVDGRPESYVISVVDRTTWVVGRDAEGAMYGALELAERLRLRGGSAVPPPATLRGTPSISIRAANMFWTLPDP